jgi:hypothetical protein
MKKMLPFGRIRTTTALELNVFAVSLIVEPAIISAASAWFVLCRI